MTFRRSSRQPLDNLDRIVTLKEAAEISSMSVDTWKRKHPDKIIRLSERRHGVRLRDALFLQGPILQGPTKPATGTRDGDGAEAAKHDDVGLLLSPLGRALLSAESSETLMEARNPMPPPSAEEERAMLDYHRFIAPVIKRSGRPVVDLLYDPLDWTFKPAR